VDPDDWIELPVEFRSKVKRFQEAIAHARQAIGRKRRAGR